MVTRPDSACASLLSSTLVVPYALLNSRNPTQTRRTSSASRCKMKEMKRWYKKAKGNVQDRLRPPSRQSTPTTPARSPRNSQDPASSQGQVLSSVPSTSVRPSELGIAPTPSATPGPGAHELEVPASSPSTCPNDITEVSAGPSEPVSSSSGLASMNSFETLRLAMDANASLFVPLQLALADLIKTGRSFDVCSHTQAPRLILFTYSHLGLLQG